MAQATAGDTLFEKFTGYMEKNTKGVEVSSSVILVMGGCRQIYFWH